MHNLSRVLPLALLTMVAGCVSRPRIQPLPVEIEVKLSDSAIAPGHALRITVVSSQAMEFSASAWDQRARLISTTGEPRTYEGYLGVPLDQKPGTDRILLSTVRANSSTGWSREIPIQILPRPPYATAKLWIKNFENYKFEAESLIMAEVRRKADYPAAGVFEGFLWPVQGHGHLSEKFGVERIYNGGVERWYHGGIDISAPQGTLIVSPAKGKVIFCRYFQAHGRTVLVDHGFGVITTYLHQSKILVREGTEVNRGDPIGHVGSTGSSTGPHLHFQINIHGIKIDPFDFLDHASKLFSNGLHP